MNASDSITELAKALAKAQLEMKPANKTATNPHFKSKYAPLPEVIEVARVLNKHGLAYVQPTYHSEHGVGIETILLHGESGQWLSGDLIIKPQQETAQGVGSAITYGRRFGLCSLAGIVADDDDDGEEASSKPPVRLVVKDDGAPTNRPAVKAVNSPQSDLETSLVEVRMSAQLKKGFATWEEKRKWRADNAAEKDKLPPAAQLRLSNLFVAAEPTGKDKSGVAP